ncbi:MAG: hypothetical protein IKF14_07990 [Atopobiaceae bacterium]|nr:hypothetical protein [Atopobiaceae bacterium]
MNIFLDDRYSLMLLRAAAGKSNGLALESCDYMQPEALSLRYFRQDRLGISKLLGYMYVRDEDKLGIVVPCAKNRIRSQRVDCRVLTRPRGAKPFLRLTSQDKENPSRLVPESTGVYVMSATNVVLGMAGRLSKLVRTDKMTHTKAKLMLLKLCLELCGTYTHDPLNPHTGKVFYRTMPWLDVKTLVNELEKDGREAGLALAREVASMAYDNSGSPQESLMGPALFFPDLYGGLQLTEFSANESLALTPDERQAIGGRTITPDFTMGKYRSVVEYVGEIHNEGENPQIDHVRSLDYQTLGYREFRLNYDDVRTRSAFMKSAARIVHVIAQHEGPSFTKRFVRLGSSKEFINRQRTLFEVFRPWLR